MEKELNSREREVFLNKILEKFESWEAVGRCGFETNYLGTKFDLKF